MIPNTAVKVAPSGRWTRRKRRAPYLQRYVSPRKFAGLIEDVALMVN